MYCESVSVCVCVCLFVRVRVCPGSVAYEHRWAQGLSGVALKPFAVSSYVSPTGRHVSTKLYQYLSKTMMYTTVYIYIVSAKNLTL